VRLNYIGNLDMIEEKFKTEFYLDMAYWVPRYDRQHHGDPSTLGKFAEFEPQIDFPTFLEHEFVSRETEFSKDARSRQHETQLGQNVETSLHTGPKSDKSAKGFLADPFFTLPPRALQIWKGGDELHQSINTGPVKNQAKTVARVSDKTSHWPRLWRTLVSDEELQEIHRKGGNAADKKRRRLLEPSNEQPEAMHKRLKELMSFLDVKRQKNLAHPDEGIVFVSFDISAEIRQSFSLQQFPYDFQELEIVIRLNKDTMDPFTRHIVPLAHDKAFFCSGRVPELTEWDITKNLDWAVVRGTQGDAARDGGKERLSAKIIVKRKHFYYTTHYVLIIFLMTSSVFSSFTFDAGNEVEARTGVIFNLLLTVVAFQYCCADSVPKTPYPTILDGYINLAFITIVGVGFVIVLFSWMAVRDERFGHVTINSQYPSDSYPKHTSDGLYNWRAETIVGSALTAGWIAGNYLYWRKVLTRVERISSLIGDDEQLGWMDFGPGPGAKKNKTKKLGGKRDVCDRRIVDE